MCLWVQSTDGKTQLNIKAMRKIKAFCEDRSISFEEIESEWLKDKE